MLLPFVKVSSLKQSPIWNLHSISEKIIPVLISNILLQTSSYIRLWFLNSFLTRILFLKMSNYLILFSYVMQCEIKETFFMNQLLCRCDYYIKFVFTQRSKKLYEFAIELNFKCDFRLFFPHCEFSKYRIWTWLVLRWGLLLGIGLLHLFFFLVGFFMSFFFF